MEKVEERFIRYARVKTHSREENADKTPSSDCQFKLAKMLVEELEALGLQAEMTENAYVYSRIPANAQTKYSIGFIAHLDTVPVPDGAEVTPVVRGDVIASDGSTILGADDKAGIAEIMAMAEYLVTHPEVKRGKIGIAFTPDEEIGHGAALFDIEKFGCNFAYTVDGEELGEISFETFNGAAFKVETEGVNIHPGQAKGRMINALVIANEFINMLPEEERPEATEGREGYYFIMGIEGQVERCVLHGIIRDHSFEGFEKRKAFVRERAELLNKKYGGKVKLTLRDQYRNCAEKIEPHMHLVENAKRAMEKEGVTPLIFPIRGGTDGSSLSFMGLPCPNICTGGLNAHGLDECVKISDMQKVVKILLNIVELYSMQQ